MAGPSGRRRRHHNVLEIRDPSRVVVQPRVVGANDGASIKNVRVSPATAVVDGDSPEVFVIPASRYKLSRPPANLAAV